MVGFSEGGEHGKQNSKTMNPVFAPPVKIGYFVHVDKLTPKAGGEFLIEDPVLGNNKLTLVISNHTMDGENVDSFLYDNMRQGTSVKIGSYAIFEVHSIPLRCSNDPRLLGVTGELKIGERTTLKRGEIYPLSLYEFAWSDFVEAVGMAFKDTLK